MDLMRIAITDARTGLLTIAFAFGALFMNCGSASPTNDRMEADRSSGQSLFNLNCALCHGRDGKLGLNGAKDLTVSMLTKEEMIATVEQGRGAMMPYRDILTSKEIDAVVTYVRSLQKK
jgi:mono/diheme cytochrome c family protein